VLPSGFILLFLLAGLILRKKFLLWVGTLLLLLFSMPLVSDCLMRTLEGSAGRVPVSSVRKADAVVVLAA
jgi:hypothetical protein